MYELRAVPHSCKPGVTIYEVWRGNVFVAAVYPTETGLKIVSKYLREPLEGAVKFDRDVPPAVLINFPL